MALGRKKSIKTFQNPAIQSGTILHGGVTIPYWFSDSRGPEGKWLVLLHGLGVDCSVWEPFLDDLIAGYNVIMLDLPGHGDNRSAYSLEDASRQILLSGTRVTPSSSDTASADVSLRHLPLLIRNTAEI